MKIRKRWIVLSSSILLIGFLFREELMEGIYFNKSEPIINRHEETTFFIATDIHYLANAINDKGKAFDDFMKKGDGKQLEYVHEITESLIREIEEKKPHALIVSGDLTTNGEKASHLELAEKFRRIENLGTEVYVIPGNHDITNSWARGFKDNEQYKVDMVNSTEFSEIYRDFGYDEAISRDKDTLSYLASPSEHTYLLMLDTNDYSDSELGQPPTSDGKITSETYEWIKACTEFAKKNDAEIITVMHHNIIEHNEVLNDGFTLKNNTQALDKFNKYGLNLVLSGHIHIQDIASYNDDGNYNDKIYDIATGSLSVYPQKYGVLEYYPDDYMYKYRTESIDVEAWAKENNIENNDLINFNEYSNKYFTEKSNNMVEKRLEEITVYTEDEKIIMKDTIANLNKRVFAGNDNKGMEEIINSEGYKLWKESSVSFYKDYINSILEDKDLDDNEFIVNFK